MRLTNTIRDAFVRAAMNDVPHIDYAEQFRKLMTDDAVAQLPPAVRTLWDNKATRDYVALASVGSRYNGFHALVPGVRDHKASATALEEGARLHKSNLDQHAARAGLQRNLKNAAYSVQTRKALADMLPEFERYLPADEATANRSVPATANLVADFSKAGWSKDKKPTK